MKINHFIDKFFWLFLVAGVLIGLWYPISSDYLISLPKPLMMVMLFLAFLKTDSIDILEKIRDYKLMVYIVLMFMIVIPILFFISVNIFDPKLAVGVLLLTAMPAGVSTPIFTDIAKGNIALSMSIVIATSLIAPFTVPLLFWMIKINNLSISPMLMFKDLVLMIFLPLVVSQIVKKYLPSLVTKTQHLFTSVNILLLFALIYAVIASKRDVILNDSVRLLLQLSFLYLIFILMHITGYLIAYKQKKENKIAITIGAAYMNNGMAIVLAAAHFEPSILVMMILSEIPWSTLLAPFKRLIRDRQT